MSSTNGYAELLEHLELQYEPFPVGVARPALPVATYEAMVTDWPATVSFRFMPDLGHKYSLSEVNNPELYRRFIEDSPVWSAFHRFVKARDFVPTVLGALTERGVDLGLDVVGTQGDLLTWIRQGSRRARRWITGRGVDRLSARFEFSMLPADGGCIRPHTDDPRKVITLVISMCKEGDWDPAWGGSTEMLRPVDPTKSFNQMNRQLGFDEVTTIDSYSFEANQCLLFVKTFNSLHCVAPMTGVGRPEMRRTLTINIEQRR